MAFFTIRNILSRRREPPRLSCPTKLWETILLDLQRRGRGEVESGGFLLGVRHGDGCLVREFLAYDDVDPNALQGAILFDGSRMDVVWDRCRQQKLEVVADVHTHPGGYGQSSIDRANPMIPERGHIALIIPNFADLSYRPGEIGIYEFLGKREGWKNHSREGRDFFYVGWLA
jgi:proteasome lid subunit RPN8/RPN11